MSDKDKSNKLIITGVLVSLVLSNFITLYKLNKVVNNQLEILELQLELIEVQKIKSDMLNKEIILIEVEGK